MKKSRILLFTLFTLALPNGFLLSRANASDSVIADQPNTVVCTENPQAETVVCSELENAGRTMQRIPSHPGPCKKTCCTISRTACVVPVSVGACPVCGFIYGAKNCRQYAKKALLCNMSEDELYKAKVDAGFPSGRARDGYDCFDCFSDLVCLATKGSVFSLCDGIAKGLTSTYAVGRKMLCEPPGETVFCCPTAACKKVNDLCPQNCL